MTKKDCFTCENCIYIGYGDYLCDVNNEIVLEEHTEPTEEFCWCKGKEYSEL